jgi:hypothetical protein
VQQIVDGAGTHAQKIFNYFKDAPEQIEAIDVKTFEVIGGISGLRFAIRTKDGQVISAGGPLKKSSDDSSTQLKVPLDAKVANLDIATLRDPVSTQKYRIDVQAQLKAVTLIGNDGAGRLNLRFETLEQTNNQVLATLVSRTVAVHPLSELQGLLDNKTEP